ncbi:MAG TPA: hypothetical protein DIW61_17330 [Candidatus Aminicenantes bacterium]|nr:hypothetical protein [Candidatus Aminicenantes bacterium]
MTNTRLIFSNLWRKGTILGECCEHPQYPSTDTQGDTPSQFWRTRHGTGSGNGLFVVTDSNKYINFDEGGAELTGTVATGSYNGNTLATAVAAAMNAAPGKALTYACVYSETNALFTISAGSNFTIRWNTGTNKAVDISGLCGFSDAADDTGALTYDGDYRRIHYPRAFITNDLLTAQTVNFLALLNHNISASATIKWRGADDDAFTVNLVEVTITHNPTNLFYFFGSSSTKRYVQIQVEDPTNPNSYIHIGPVVMGTYWEPARPAKSPYGKARPDDSIVDESYALVEFGQPRPRRKTWSLPFSGLSETDADTIILFFDEVGITHGFVLCLDYNSPNSYSYFVKNVELIEAVQDYHDSWSWALNIREKL